MTSKERLITALRRETPDRLPVTVHQWQQYHLKTYLGGITDLEAFKMFGMDAAIQYCEPVGLFLLPGAPNFPQTQDWKVDIDVIENTPIHRRLRYTFTTPKGVLTCATEGDAQTTWFVEPLIKRQEEIELLTYMPVSRIDKKRVSEVYDRLGDDGILRGHGWGDQIGCWQHACCLFGTQEMLFAAMDDPDWVHQLLSILLGKKLQFIEESLDGAKFDVVESGGGAASSTVVSPSMFEEFCLPYDRRQHEAMHRAGQLITYHTCGGMMGILDQIERTGTDASETLSPPGVGGNIKDRMAVKNTLGKTCCLIGGMDQYNILAKGTPEAIQSEVDELFSTFGVGGGYIMSTADHFFDAPAENLKAYADAAKSCVY